MRPLLSGILSVPFGIILSLLPAPAGGVGIDYARDIKPLLKERCYSCHGALKQKAGLRLDTVAAMRRGGDGGDILSRDGSVLIERVVASAPEDRMPPEGEGSVLSAAQVAMLRAWIAAGAPTPVREEPEPDPRDHWAYRPPRSSGRSLDNLIETRLAAGNISPQPEAAPETWLRRVHLDLVGLPPSPDEIRAFLGDGSPAARERVVDRLLASPQYGERWGRHFMDIWRYCDWYGLGAQLRHSQKHIWHWRDWIIEALNADLGYDRMIVEMLAADEASPADRDSLRATGFLARSYYLFNRTTWLDETIEHMCRALLGVTMQCVKCHDHKYDPFEHADYYRLRAIFEPLHVRLDPWPGETDLEKNGLPRVFDLHHDRPTYRHVRGDEKNEDRSRTIAPGIPGLLAFAEFEPRPVSLPAASARPVLLPFVIGDHLGAADRDLRAARQAFHDAAIRSSAAAAIWSGLNSGGSFVPVSAAAADGVLGVLLAGKRLAAAEARPSAVRAIFAADQAAGDRTLAATAAAAEAGWKLAEAEAAVLEAERAPSSKDREKNLKSARDALEKARKRVAAPATTYASLRASLKAQEGPEEADAARVQVYPATSTGRRLALARWIADRRHPLTARVLVNHVWLRHFGAPIVADVSDFGRRAPRPLQQDVLDTLAVDFMEGGWSLKRLHRTMVLSRLYARSSSNAGADPRALATDPDNHLYWRMNPRRLESQAVRDSLLQIAGRLDPTVGGPSLDAVASESSARRSIYFTQNADIEHRFLAAFDNANVLECYRRVESVVPQQALALTNSRLSRECAEALAGRLAPRADEAFLTESFLAILGRAPTDPERRAALEGYRALRGNRALFLQALLNHNDFITLR